MSHDEPHVRIDGRTLTCRDIVRVARSGASVRLDETARERAQDAWELVENLTATRQVYGRTTGVGANRQEEVDGEAALGHGLRLLRSHAGGVGPLLPDDQVRATLVVRLNQLAAGGSGVQPRVLDALEQAIRRRCAARGASLRRDRHRRPDRPRRDRAHARRRAPVGDGRGAARAARHR